MHQLTDSVAELSFMESKTGLKIFIISLFSVQFFFHVFALLYIQIISNFQLALNFNASNPRLLSTFALDVWIIVFLVSLSLVGYSILKKVKEFSLYLLIAYPTMLITLSLVRDVSPFQVLILSLLSCAIVIRFNYQKIKQLECSQA